jgi:hypothetical protein
VDCEEYKDESELVDLSKEGGQQHSCPTHRKPCSHRQEVRAAVTRGAGLPVVAAPTHLPCTDSAITRVGPTPPGGQDLGTCHDSCRAPLFCTQENYFFALSRYQEQLEALLEADAGAFVVPSSRRNEVAGWVREGARDFSISRAGCTWGIPIPQVCVLCGGLTGLP